MTKTQVLGRKCVADLMRPGVEGMAFKARLYPDRTDLLPKMLLGIADDLRSHFVSQGVFRLIVDRNVRQSRCSSTIMPCGGVATLRRGMAHVRLRSRQSWHGAWALCRPSTALWTMGAAGRLRRKTEISRGNRRSKDKTKRRA